MRAREKKTMKMQKTIYKRVQLVNPAKGFSLLELMIVMVILIAMAMIVIPTFTNVQITKPNGKLVSPIQIATEATMTTVRKAVVGEDGIIENLSHKANALPRQINDLVKTEAPDYIKEMAPELAVYDPVIRIGWRGPYLLPTGNNKFGEPTIVDGWGNELELQIDFDNNGQIDQNESKYARVVSAGPNGKIDTPADTQNMEPGSDDAKHLTRSECGDDLVMFMRVPDNRQ